MVGGWVLATNLPVRNIYAVLAISAPRSSLICIFWVGRIPQLDSRGAKLRAEWQTTQIPDRLPHKLASGVRVTDTEV